MPHVSLLLRDVGLLEARRDCNPNFAMLVESAGLRDSAADKSHYPLSCQHYRRYPVLVPLLKISLDEVPGHASN